MTERFPEPLSLVRGDNCSWICSGGRAVMELGDDVPEKETLKVLLSEEFRRMLQKAHGEGFKCFPESVDPEALEREVMQAHRKAQVGDIPFGGYGCANERIGCTEGVATKDTLCELCTARSVLVEPEAASVPQMGPDFDPKDYKDLSPRRRKVVLKHHSDGRVFAVDDGPVDSDQNVLSPEAATLTTADWNRLCAADGRAKPEPKDFPCDDILCSGRVDTKGAVCTGSDDCKALEREAQWLIKEIPGVDHVDVGRAGRDGPLVITLKPEYGPAWHAVHLAIAKALWSSDITRGYTYSLVIL